MREVSWFSCGAASAVATKIRLSENPDLEIVYCKVIEEHEDNIRFLHDCERWFKKKITILCNEKYHGSIYEVFEKVRYMSGHKGAACTLRLKKELRLDFQKPNDIQVFGYTVEEQNRLDSFIDANNEVDVIAPLIDKGLTKSDCLAMIENAGIELPAMYKLGYKNNNCRGCVKAQSPAYWKKIKIDFPDYFDKAKEYEKKLNVKICKATINGVKDTRMFLDELPAHIKPMDNTVDIQCGIFCEMAQSDYKKSDL